MKIAIYYNLKKGGALKFLEEILTVLNRQHYVDLYTLDIADKPRGNNLNQIHTFATGQKTKNIFSNTWFILTKLKRINQKIAHEIDSKKYDLAIIFPCLETQSPYILKFLRTKNIYVFTETKREFYEETRFRQDIKSIITKLIRIPIKYIDINNCKRAERIIAISYYCSFILKKIYQRDSFVVHPGLDDSRPIPIKILNKHNAISVGQLSKIKGHDFSIRQIKNIKNIKLEIIGRTTKEWERHKNETSISATITNTENDLIVTKKYKKSTFYLSNQNNEPFGIATLEASIYNCFIVGVNNGGTPEIVRHGINGFLYPKNTKTAHKILKKINKNKVIGFYRQTKINWTKTTNKILKINTLHA